MVDIEVGVGFGLPPSNEAVLCYTSDELPQPGTPQHGVCVHAKHRNGPIETLKPPLAWFLPSPKRMRGGAARHFASAWLPHRGIHLESTCRMISEKATRYQRLATSQPWRAGFFCGIQGIQFAEATAPEAAFLEATESTCVFHLTKLPPLTHTLIIEE